MGSQWDERSAIEDALGAIPSQLTHLAVEAIESGDASGLLCLIPNTAGMGFVFDNLQLLKSKAMLEAAVVHAYTAEKHNFHQWPARAIAWLLCHCDRERLLASGDMPAPAEPVEVYRGVSGSGKARKVSGLSWTSSMDVAAWFALRYDLADPAIYRVTVRPGDVFFCTNERNEHEYVCDIVPGKPRRVKLSLDELRSLEQQEKERRRIAHEQWLAEIKAKQEAGVMRSAGVS